MKTTKTPFNYSTAIEGKYYYHITLGIVTLYDKPNLCVGYAGSIHLVKESELFELY